VENCRKAILRSRPKGVVRNLLCSSPMLSIPLVTWVLLSGTVDNSEGSSSVPEMGGFPTKNSFGNRTFAFRITVNEPEVGAFLAPPNYQHFPCTAPTSRDLALHAALVSCCIWFDSQPIKPDAERSSIRVYPQSSRTYDLLDTKHQNSCIRICSNRCLGDHANVKTGTF
jgi:hypothetical protein